MLNVSLRPHRGALKASTADEQKLFAMLKVMPRAEVSRSRTPLAFALVIDTSGSMREFADQERAAAVVRSRGLSVQAQQTGDGGGLGVNLGLPTKLDQAIAAAHAFLDDPRLTPEDQVTIVHFDDDARTVLPLTPLARKAAAHQAADSLRDYSGGTHMARGLECASRELAGLAPHVAKRVILLTDGDTFDEPRCRPVAGRLAESNTPIIALGIGVEYNEDLLRDLADVTRGRPAHLARMEELRDLLDEEIETTAREVVTDLQLSVSTVKGVSLTGLTRVYPSLAEVDAGGPVMRLGNVPSGDFTVFVLELTVSGVARPPSRVRLARIGLTGHVTGLGRREELPPEDLFVTFTADDAAVAEVDAEVLGYVQQKNVDRLVRDAIQASETDPERARKTLQVAAGMTQRLGNPAMTRILHNAVDELNRSGTISLGTRKTVALGGRTRTVKTGATVPLEGVPSAEDIRKITGA